MNLSLPERPIAVSLEIVRHIGGRLVDEVDRIRNEKAACRQ